MPELFLFCLETINIQHNLNFNCQSRKISLNCLLTIQNKYFEFALQRQNTKKNASNSINFIVSQKLFIFRLRNFLFSYLSHP